MTQMSFVEYEVIEHGLYIADKCKECANKCKVYSISQSAEVYCKKYKKDNTVKDK
jgi:ribosomal protein S27E